MLHVQSCSIVVRKGERGRWDSFGVRDPAILCDEDGFLKKVNSRYYMYYTASSNGYDQVSGLCFSESIDSGWVKYDQPVIRPSPSGWDSGISTTPWVVYCSDGYFRAYYRGGRYVYKDEGLGLAVSSDGINFEKVGDRPLISVWDIDDIARCKVKLMGVMNFAKTFDNKNLVLFEASSYRFNQRAQIFAVVSDKYDRNFAPFGDGYPLFSREHVSSWYVEAVANPRLYSFPKYGIYMLVFNGAPSKTIYSIGIAFSRDLKNWFEYKYNPILIPSIFPPDYQYSARLEGGVFIKEELLQERDEITMFFMAIPLNSISHQNSVVALCKMKLLDMENIDTKISYSAFSKRSIDFINRSIALRKNEEYFPRIFISGKIKFHSTKNALVAIKRYRDKDLFDVSELYIVYGGKKIKIHPIFLRILLRIVLKIEPNYLRKFGSFMKAIAKALIYIFGKEIRNKSVDYQGVFSVEVLSGEAKIEIM
ncbi:MAG: hypothetical protein N2254_09705 [bacterium]|nr:hypothetical protein [bacterium]